MDASATTSCHACGALVAKDELAQGLAVRIDGNLICPLCVDGLPGEAQVKINQVRALRGLNSVTYRVDRPRHPQLAAYTFTTAGNLVVHRRELASSGRFAAPMLPPPSERPAAPVAAPNLTPRRLNRNVLLGSVSLAVVGIGLALVTRGSGAATNGPVATIPIPTETTRPAKRRLDYASGALRAWDEAATDPDCPAEVREAIAAEVIAARTRALDDAERALEGGNPHLAATTMAGDEVPQHVLFAALHRRADSLAQRIAAPPLAPIPTPPVALASPPPVPPPSLAPAPVPTPAAPIAVAVSPSSSDCLLLKAADLAEAAGRNDWDRNKGGLSLSNESGSLARTLALAGGHYQVWVRARGVATAASVQVVLGKARTAPTVLPPAKTAAWHRLADSIELPPGPCRLQVVALGLGAVVADIYLAGTDLPTPERVAERATAPTWLPDTPDTVEPPKPTAQVGPWSPRFLGVHPVVDPLDPLTRVPTGLPGNAGPIHESVAKNRKKHGFTLDLTGVDISGGGVALLVHPVRPDRTQLAITLIDADDKRHLLPAMALEPGRWNTVLVPAAAGAGQVDADRLKAIAIEDVNPLTTSFLLAKVAIGTGEAPTATALELRDPALLPLPYADLERALTAVAAKRRSRNWRRDFDPALLKVLIGHQLLMGEWNTLARKGLAEVLKEPLKNDELPVRTIQAIVLQDQWLDALFEPPPDTPAVLDPAKHHLVILCTAGIEFPVGLSEPQAFLNLWVKLIDKCIERGVLPVTVLGPNKVDAADVAEVELLWSHVETYLRKNRPGLPILDLRPARAISYQRFAPGMAKLSVNLLVDGYGELYRRILALKKLK